MLRRSSRSTNKYTRYNNVQLVHGGREYFDKLLELISNARHTLHLQVYIFEADDTGRQVAEALQDAARRGVAVYLLTDGYASQGLPADLIRQLRAAGVHFRFFEPLLRSSRYYFGRRLHHKVLAIDGCCCLVGGINISNKYNEGYGQPAWLDWALYAEGEVASQVMTVCLEFWTRSPKKRRRLLARMPRPDPLPATRCHCRIRRNDWVHRRNQVTKSYLELLRNARSELFLVSSYFLPGRLLRRQLLAAAARGVQVNLLLAGVSDVMLAKHAERYIYRKILRQGIRIFEYRSAILHGKMGVYDNAWATIGSYNLNNISAFASLELNIDVMDENFAGQLQQELKTIIRTDCVPITEEGYRTNYGFWTRCWQRICYELVRFLFFIFTFYFRQQSARAGNPPKQG
ncbi:MAG: phospholipase D-like domain-containing protein [Candidatus Pseudobacter hemicellulosilyticus]|uniref:Phospholipase D-like domain-containing protein n=1 Tax=Candidatus Pseudobacter hemicellulosilyticus TaxID=3121375 RepID=A0AAJ5WWT7_9BACT|nr:MAG: phospholipase D-like domain-containing protein [Pseudobacter sp.]